MTKDNEVPTFEEFKVKAKKWPTIEDRVDEIKELAAEEWRGDDKYKWAKWMLDREHDQEGDDLYPTHLTPEEIVYLFQFIKAPNGFIDGPVALDPCRRIVEANTEVLFTDIDKLIKFNFLGYHIYKIQRSYLVSYNESGEIVSRGIPIFRVRMAPIFDYR